MKSGKLAVVVIIATLAATILGGWALSTDVNEVTKTSYNELADITPIFNIEDAPEFVSYNSSANYTGYYTANSIIGSKKYFDGVDYVQSIRANIYKLTEAPVIDYSGSVTLSDYTGNYPFTDPDSTILYSYVENDRIRSHSNTTASIVTLDSYIAAMNLGANINKVTIQSNNNISSADVVNGSQADVNWVLFTLRNAWDEGTGGNNTVVVCTPEWFEKNNVSPGHYDPNNKQTYYYPAISCDVDLNSNTVALYLDKDQTELMGYYSTSNVIMCYGGNGSGTTKINFDSTADITTATVTSNYMDPSSGVELL